jgi:hypothetical protein
MDHAKRRAACLALVVAPWGCGLLDLFEGPVAECRPGETRTEPATCGVCGKGDALQECGADGAWTAVACRDPLDADGDGWPGEACGRLPGGCCTERRDCDDADPEVHPETWACVFRALPESPDYERCTTAQGGPGWRICRRGCRWSRCAPEEFE